MKEKSKNNNRSYLDALKKLRQLIAASYPDGGWLPSSRELCEKFKVNRRTYSKALQCLEQEGVAKAYPKKGHYINPEFLRVNKIGIVIGNAEESPFFQSDEILCAIFDVLRENKFNAQLMQAADLNNIMDKALIHGVKGLIWLFPSKQTFPYISSIHNTSELPIVVSSSSYIKEIATSKVTSILPDPEKANQKRAVFLVKRKHKKVAIVANAETEQRIKKSFIRLLKKENIDCVFIPHDENGKIADLTPLALDSTITGLLVDGGSREIFNIFSALSQLPKHSLRDICLHYTEKLDAIRSMFPQIKVTGIGRSDTAIPGEIAAKMLLDNLIKGKPLKSQKVDYFNLSSK